MNTQKAQEAVKDFGPKEVQHYIPYWEAITPKTDEEVFRRWLFAYLSIHTTWESNVRGYEMLKDLSWWNDKQMLLDKLILSKCGMQNARQKYIWQFREQFEKNPSYYGKISDSWIKTRNKLTEECHGIGITKVSFVLEMCHPLDAQVVCLDTHLLQLYEITGTKTKAQVQTYHDAEEHWLNMSNGKGIAPYILRSAFWDKKQGYEDNDYWAYVFTPNGKPTTG